MPTSRKPDAVTETPLLQGALDEPRRKLGSDRVDARLRSLADRIRSGDVLVDLDAANEVRATGWTRG